MPPPHSQSLVSNGADRDACGVQETPYGFRKRLSFAAEVLAEGRPSRVLDVGCGTGTMLTRPLAERFATAQFIGLEPDAVTRKFASGQNSLPNLQFCGWTELRPADRFDLVIASEVLEHVDDPLEFLALLRSRMSPRAKLLLTTPNGFGPFEWASAMEMALRVTHADRALRRVKHQLGSSRSREPSGQHVGQGAPEVSDTLAVSPHVNFFSWSLLERLFSDSGLAIDRYRGRTVFCGYVFDHYVVRGRTAIRLNARLADYLPPQLVSDWMFVLAPTAPARRVSGYRRTRIERQRRRMSERLSVQPSA